MKSPRIACIASIGVVLKKDTCRYDKIRGVKKVSTYRVYRVYRCRIEKRYVLI